MGATSTTGVQVIDVALDARVTVVIDPNQSLGGVVGKGDTVVGSFRYFEGASDLDPDPNHGRYTFKNAPYGIEANVAGLSFRSDPAKVDFTIRLTNNVCAKGYVDCSRITSASNLDVLGGLKVKDINIQLEDRNGMALTSDKLTDFVPRVRYWPSLAELKIEGSTGWQIKARITAMGGEVPLGDPKTDGTRKYFFDEY